MQDENAAGSRSQQQLQERLASLQSVCLQLDEQAASSGGSRASAGCSSMPGDGDGQQTEVLEKLKNLASCTKDYDHFFLNFCINYDGQEEIVDAIRILSRQLLAGKVSPENINKEMIKENLYSSYFIGPDLMIKNSDSKMDSFLLWDCVGAKRVFTSKDFPDLTKSEVEKIIH